MFELFITFNETFLLVIDDFYIHLCVFMYD